MKKIVLFRGKDRSLERRHPWVFSGAIHHTEGNPDEGDWVSVVSAGGRQLGAGFYEAEGSIRVRMVWWGAEETTAEAAIRRHIGSALLLRKQLGLTGQQDITAYRAIFGEGDSLPGLVVDHYDGIWVVQAHTWGMYLHRQVIAQVLADHAGAAFKAAYGKSIDTLPAPWAARAEDDFLLGKTQGAAVVKEHALSYLVDIQEGQKTGFFLDQRDNRALVRQYAAGKRVLNTFSYTGGFSVCAAAGGAKLVHSVDSSKPAIQLLEQNMGLNGFAGDVYKSYKADVFDFLKQMSKEAYDLVILDPPAFAKHVKSRHNALMAYKRLNAMAMERMPADSLLFTFSCSQVVGRELFDNTVMAAAIESGRSVQVLHYLSQPPDHPVSIFHPEGMYLKGLALWVR